MFRRNFTLPTLDGSLFICDNNGDIHPFLRRVSGL
jgi:hypothetical protein